MRIIKSQEKSREREDAQYNLFKDLHRLGRFERNGKMWISQEYFEELSELFEKYPTHHSKIVNANKIDLSKTNERNQEFIYKQ